MNFSFNKFSKDIIYFSNLFKKGDFSYSKSFSLTKTIHLNQSLTKENVLLVLPIAILE